MAKVLLLHHIDSNVSTPGENLLKSNVLREKSAPRSHSFNGSGILSRGDNVTDLLSDGSFITISFMRFINKTLNYLTTFLSCPPSGITMDLLILGNWQGTCTSKIPPVFSSETFPTGDAVQQPQSRKVEGAMPRRARALPVSSGLHVLPGSAWVPSRFSDFLPLSRNTHIKAKSGQSWWVCR